MASHSHATTALLTEHFRYTPLTLLDEIINTVNELVYHAVNQLEKALSNAPTEVLGFELDDSTTEHLGEESREAAIEELRQNEVDLGIVQIESLLNATIDKDFDKFEIYTLRNILAIGHDEDADLARWVCLDHYRHLTFDPSQHQQTPESVQLQRRKLHETAKLNSMLREEQARNERIIQQLESLAASNDRSKASLGFLTSHHRTGEPLTEAMRQAIQQLPNIREALSQLQTSRISLATRPARSQQDAVLQKRRAYLDSQAVKALNRRGIEPEGEGIGLTSLRGATKENVNGLETIIHGLGALNRTSTVG